MLILEVQTDVPLRYEIITWILLLRLGASVQSRLQVLKLRQKTVLLRSSSPLVIDQLLDDPVLVC